MGHITNVSRRGFFAAATAGVACLAIQDLVGPSSPQTGESGIRLDQLTSETFSPHLGTQFRVFDKSNLVAEVELSEVTSHQTKRREQRPESMRKPFSVVFRGSKTGEFQQGTYIVEHSTLGRYELFVVPGGQATQSVELHAVFA